MDLLKNLTTKQKQRIKVLAILAVVALVVAIGASFTGKKEDKKPEALKKDRKFTVLSDRVEKDLWVAAEGQNIKALEKSNQEMRAEMEKMRKEMEDAKRKQAQPAGQKAQQPGAPRKPGSKADGDIPVPVPPPFGSESSQKDKAAREARERPGKPGKQAEPPAGAIRVWQADVKKTQTNTKEQEKAKTERDHVWVPTGTIMKAVMLSGIDVPSSLAAKHEPYPTLMMLSDYSLLPNRFRMDMKECFIIGAGYANMVEERAYIRTETLSCIRSDGTPWEVGLKGQVVGEDGKLGMRGKVISKQGSQIAMSIVTGVLSGLSNALKPQTALSYVQLQKEDNKVTTLMPNMGDVAMGAGLTGTGSALGRISDYYLKLAEQMYPVVEIDAGREVEIMVVRGGKLAPQETAKLNTRGLKPAPASRRGQGAALATGRKGLLASARYHSGTIRRSR